MTENLGSFNVPPIIPRRPWNLISSASPADLPADGGLYTPVANSAIPDGHTAWTYTDGLWRPMPADSALEAGRGYLHGE